jgi:hypothetical protein
MGKENEEAKNADLLCVFHGLFERKRKAVVRSDNGENRRRSITHVQLSLIWYKTVAGPDPGRPCLFMRSVRGEWGAARHMGHLCPGRKASVTPSQGIQMAAGRPKMSFRKFVNGFSA